MNKPIHTPKAPAAIGPYSQAVQAGSMLFVSGQIPIDPATGNFAGNDIVTQTKQSLTNIQNILEAAGYSLSAEELTSVEYSVHNMDTYATLYGYPDGEVLERFEGSWSSPEGQQLVLELYGGPQNSEGSTASGEAYEMECSLNYNFNENALVLNHHPSDLERHFEGCFDKVLVDAPCSGEGMFRKEEAAVTDWSEETVNMCAERQAQILATAARLLRKGGRLVYSTCTFAPAEDEGAVTEFLRTHPDFSIEAVEAPALSPGRPDCIPDPAPGIEHTFRLWPHHQKGEGHYAAVLRKAGDEESALIPSKADKLPKEWTDFAKSMGITLPAGKPALFGSTLWWLPENAPELKGLKVLRPGLELGECKKGRFEPAHALALWLKTCASVQDYAPDSPEMAAYIHGDVVPSTQKGWTLVTAGNLSIGWGKGDGKILKNHYPKGLRR